MNTSATPTQSELPSNAIFIEPEEEIEKAANQMGSTGDRFLIITNLDPDNEGEITINVAA